MRFLNGAELAAYIKDRQAKQVRALRQAHHIFPRLAIVLTDDNPASVKYIKLKQQYGADILVDVVLEQVPGTKAVKRIQQHNDDPATHGIVVQLPLSDPTLTEEVLASITPEKDVDGLGSNDFFDPATPTAILWLLAGYNIEPRGKKVVVIGKGRLVGSPLIHMLETSGVDVVGIDRNDDIAAATENANLIVTATGSPGLLTPELIPQKAVVVDAGVAGEGGVLKGDVADEVYETRDDLTITPQKGGVGPLTVCALFDGVIRSARRQAEAQD